MSKSKAKAKAKAKAKEKLTRAQRAAEMWASGVRPVKIASHAWDVQGSNGRFYQVEELPDGTYNCTCPDGLYRSHSGEMCKHVLVVLMLMADDARAAEDQIQIKTCDSCARARNHNAPYLLCGSWLHALVQHDKPACDHYTTTAVSEAKGQDADLLIV